MADRTPIPEIPLLMSPKSSNAKAIVSGSFGHQQAGDKHKLGGDPDWIQGDETPECSECCEPMEFYGQFDHLGDIESLKDFGMIYVFLCRECYTTESVLQFS